MQRSASSSYKRPRTKWWKPLDKAQQELFEQWKRNIRQVLISSKVGLKLGALRASTQDYLDEDIPFLGLGFRNMAEFLFHMDDILEVRKANPNFFTSSDQKYIFVKESAIPEDLQHLRELVRRQNPAKKKGFKPTHGNTIVVPSEELLQYSAPQGDPKPLPGRGSRSSGFDYSSGGGGYGGGRRSFGGFDVGRLQRMTLAVESSLAKDNFDDYDSEDDDYGFDYCGGTTKNKHDDELVVVLAPASQNVLQNGTASTPVLLKAPPPVAASSVSMNTTFAPVSTNPPSPVAASSVSMNATFAPFSTKPPPPVAASSVSMNATLAPVSMKPPPPVAANAVSMNAMLAPVPLKGFTASAAPILGTTISVAPSSVRGTSTSAASTSMNAAPTLPTPPVLTKARRVPSVRAAQFSISPETVDWPDHARSSKNVQLPVLPTINEVNYMEKTNTIKLASNPGKMMCKIRVVLSWDCFTATLVDNSALNEVRALKAKMTEWYKKAVDGMTIKPVDNIQDGEIYAVYFPETRKYYRAQIDLSKSDNGSTGIGDSDSSVSMMFVDLGWIKDVKIASVFPLQDDFKSVGRTGFYGKYYIDNDFPVQEVSKLDMFLKSSVGKTFGVCCETVDLKLHPVLELKFVMHIKEKH